MNKEEIIEYIDEELKNMEWVCKLDYAVLTDLGRQQIYQRQRDFRELKKLIKDVTT